MTISKFLNIISGASRPKRTTFNFVEPGQYQREGQRIRMKAQLEKLQAEISTISRKTGITSATQLAKLVPKTDTKCSEPDVEWWDALIMVNGHSSKYVIGKLSLGPRYYLDTSALDIFGKSVPMSKFKKWY